MRKVIVTCPPMLGLFQEFVKYAAECDIELIPAQVTQTLSEEELIQLIPHYEGWIIGDDPATKTVFTAGKSGHLKAAVKWGIGVDNVDFQACEQLNIPITNTPNMFGEEVADIAVGYLVGLARDLFFIDRNIRLNQDWVKPAGISLKDKRVALVGLGDIGKKLLKRLEAMSMKVIAYDPGVKGNLGFSNLERAIWPEKLEVADFVIFTCSLNNYNTYMFNSKTISKCKAGVHVINVARGQLIDENALISALEKKHVAAAALDVFEIEPLPVNSPLRKMERCIFGTHNGSNTKEAVRRTSFEAIRKLKGFLDE